MADLECSSPKRASVRRKRARQNEGIGLWPIATPRYTTPRALGGCPILTLILRCRESGLEGDLRKPLRKLEGSFEAPCLGKGHLRMRGLGGTNGFGCRTVVYSVATRSGAALIEDGIARGLRMLG